MRFLWLMLRLQWHVARNAVAYAGMRDRLYALFVGGVSLFFLVGVYVVSRLVVVYVSTLPVIGRLFMLRIVALAYLSTFVMLAFSALITALSTLYGADDTEFLAALPVPLRPVFAAKSGAVLTQSSWTMLVVLLPFMVAFAQSQWLPVPGLVIMLAALCLMLAIAVELGIGAALVLSALFPSRMVKDLAVVVVILLFAGGYAALRFAEPERLLNPDRFDELVSYLDFMAQPLARGLPSWWAAETVRGVVARKPAVVWASLGSLTAVFGGVAAVLWGAAGSLYYRGLFPAWKNPGRSGRSPAVRSPRLLSLAAALVRKEAAQVFREPMQWTQLVIVVSLVMVYLFSIQKLPIQHEALRLTVAFINVGAVMFILTSFALRFVFVQPSLEYRTVWLLKAAPIPLRAIFLTKAALYLPVMLALGLTLTLASNTLLGVPRAFTVVGGAAVCVAGIALTVAAYSFGVMFPKTEFQTIADVETSFGGLAFLVVSLFYIVASVVAFAYPVREFILGRRVPPETVAFHAGVFILVNLAYAVPVGIAGWRRFRERFG